jgi:orotidine-5'-phosphate decarboxylase
MGYDSIEPFLKYKDRITFVLGLTSNPGASEFEKQILLNNTFLFQEVLKKINLWNESNNCGAVFGATQIKELSENIEYIRKIVLLIPGIGAQGGSLEEVVGTFVNEKIDNFLINSSRGIIYKDNSADFGEAAKVEILKLNEIIRTIKSQC